MEIGATGKTVTLKSSDGVQFVVPEAVAMQFQVIPLLFGDNSTKDPIPVLNVGAKILEKVIEYCEHQIGVLASPEQGKGRKEMDTGNRKKNQSEMSDWEEEFFDVDQETAFALVVAADHLYINKLLDLACEKVADMISGKTVEEIREAFDIVNDFTPEEEEGIRREYGI